ncbi:ABC transporter ATP-binding protein [Candidatus Enterococcus clewellii]
MTYFTNIKKNIYIFLITLFLVTVLALPLPLLSKYLVDDVIATKNLTTLSILIIIFLIIILLQIVFNFINTKYFASLSQTIIKDIRYRIYSSIISDHSSDKVESGKIQTLLLNDSEQFVNNELEILSTILQKLILVFGYFIISMSLSPLLTLICISLIPIYTFWVIWSSNHLKENILIAQNTKDAFLEIYKKDFSNRYIIKLFNFVFYSQKRINTALNIHKSATEKVLVRQNLIYVISSVISSLAIYSPLFFGVYLVITNRLTLGTLMAFQSYSALLFPALADLLSLIGTNKINDVYFDRLLPYLEKKQEDRRPSNRNLVEPRFLIEVLDFEIKDKLDFFLFSSKLEIKKGAWIDLVGINGSGKTVFLKCLSKQIETYNGIIRIDGVNLKNICVENLAKNVVYVSSNQGFISDTIQDELSSENIVYLKKLFEIVLLNKKIEHLPKGYSTTLEELECLLSTGELQKFRIARALSKAPKVLLLDEILSNIDLETRKNIINNIKKNYPKLTVISVDHISNQDNNCKLLINKNHLHWEGSHEQR